MSTTIAPQSNPSAVHPDAPELPMELLEARICAGAANLTAAEHEWLLAVAEFDRRRGWEVWEMPSCAHWLSWHVSLDLRAARERVRVANALGEFPLISAEMASGRLSYSKVRAITRVVAADTEADLVAMALAGTTNHVERIVAGYRRALRGRDEWTHCDRRQWTNASCVTT